MGGKKAHRITGPREKRKRVLFNEEKERFRGDLYLNPATESSREKKRSPERFSGEVGTGSQEKVIPLAKKGKKRRKSLPKNP